MTYAVKEIFYTLQGEGAQVGRPAVFCRFSGCNLWSGREEDRAKAACTFCDTDFVGVDGLGGGKFASATELANSIAETWPRIECGRPLVVFTGGEPLLQVDASLIDAVHARGFEIALETNGTRELPEGIDWVCVSPKGRQQLRITSGHELKLVFPQSDNHPSEFEGLPFLHKFLQPLDGLDSQRNLVQAIEYCLEHPQWRLSLQAHKLIGIA